MDKQQVIFRDLGIIDYQSAWDYQENLLQENLAIKVSARSAGVDVLPRMLPTTHHLLFCEHPPVYTLGKSGHMENLLLPLEQMGEQGVSFFKTNRGGDITFHGLQQLVGYPIFDLEKFDTDIGKYLRNIEEVIIRTIASFGIKGARSKGETGVWIEPGIYGRERKIAAIGVRCSRWITMHGFALNVNTDLAYFNNIIPCGIQNKQVTSIEKETGSTVDFSLVKKLVKENVELVFETTVTD